MKVEWVPFRELLELKRAPITVNAEESYSRIGIFSWGKGMLRREPTPGAGMGGMRYFTFPIPSLIFSNIQAWEGAVALAGPEDADHVCSSRFYPYVPREGVDIELAYLYEYFRSAPGGDVMRRSSPGTQVRNKVLSRSMLESSLLPVPSRREQTRIAAHLAAVATYREKGPKVVDLRATLPRILGDLLRVQELPNVPLSELCGNRQTVIHPGDSLQGADRFVGLEHIESHTGQSTGGRPIGTESGRKLLFEPGNVTYGYLRPYLNKAWVADITGLCSVEQFVLVPGNGVDPNLLSVVLRSDIVLQAAKEATNSLQLPRLSLRVLLGIEVPDIRRLDNAPEVLREASSLTRSVIRLAELTSKRRQLAESLLPAARNEIFNAMR